MRFWPRKLRRENALQKLLDRLEYERYTVEHDHDGSGLRPIRDRTGKLLGHVDRTACFIYVAEDKKEVPAVQHIISIVRQLRKRGLAVSLSDGGKPSAKTAASAG